MRTTLNLLICFSFMSCCFGQSYPDPITFTIDNSNLSPKPKFELGAKWTYERINRIPNITDFVTYEVVDTITMDSMACYIIDRIIDQELIASDTLCVNGNRVFTPDEKLASGYQLLYDFDAIDTYSVECLNSNNMLEFTEVTVDSIVTLTTADGQLITTRFLNGNCNSGFASPTLRVYDGIGPAEAGLFQCIDFCNNLGDPNSYVLGELRCFENTTESFRFVDYPCDSTWVRDFTSVKEVNTRDYTIYPNPTQGVIYVASPQQDLSYRLTNIQGQIITQGSYSREGVSIPNRGLFYLMLIYDGGIWTRRVVNY